MAGSITPLPVMLEEQEDRRQYEKLEPPKSVVVRYGYQKLIAELAYEGEEKPGCGSKLVIRTQRGIELGEMLTSTCPNAGCSKSITRRQMLQYIENSGGKEFPFTDQGKVLRIARAEDLNEQARLDAQKPEIVRQIKSLVQELDLDMRLIEAELLLGGERMLVYYTAEQRVDFRELVRRLASTYRQRIEMRQVNAREEARLVADYEKCGQHCCCKQFLKVLKPVSMRSAKVQKATLDPLKISGRCGRLMCCLRYEDQTYEDLRKQLPHRKTLVETEDGIGEVQDTQILTQLVLVQIGEAAPQAYPLEAIQPLDKEQTKAYRQAQKDPASPQKTDDSDTAFASRDKRKAGESNGRGKQGGRRNAESQSADRRENAAEDRAVEYDSLGEESVNGEASSKGDGSGRDNATTDGGAKGQSTPDQESSAKRRRKRRRRGRGRGRGGRGSSDNSGNGNTGSQGGG